jgi:RING finger/CHY zinc finger protein 1
MHSNIKNLIAKISYEDEIKKDKKIKNKEKEDFCDEIITQQLEKIKQEKIINSGCEHFTHKLQILCNTCNNKYSCVLCHNQKEDHEYKFKNIICRNCNYKNTNKNACENCGTKLFDYQCSKCNIYTAVKISHCDKCNVCYKKYQKHKCFNKNNNICCVCLESFNNDIMATAEICEHNFHNRCIQALIALEKPCPLCRQKLDY